MKAGISLGLVRSVNSHYENSTKSTSKVRILELTDGTSEYYHCPAHDEISFWDHLLDHPVCTVLSPPKKSRALLRQSLPTRPISCQRFYYASQTHLLQPRKRLLIKNQIF